MAQERGNVLLRRLDRWAGIPLVAALGAAKTLRRRNPPQRIQRVGLLKTAAIGDTVLLSAITQDLLARGGVEVSIFTGASNASAARLIEGVARVVPLPVTRPATAIRMLRDVPLDVIIDFGQWPRIDAALAALSGAQWTVGWRTQGEWRHFAYDQAVEHLDEVHEIENFRRLVQAIGVTTGSPPRLGAGEPVPAGLLPSRRFAVFHMWSGGFMGERKQWPEERWRALAAQVAGQGLDVVLTGGPDDVAATAAFHATLGDLSRRVHDLAGKLTLAQTLGLLRRSAVVVSVNTGVMHMAAVVGSPLVSLEGPVPVQRWGPLGSRATSVVSSHPGAGYLHLGGEYAGAPVDTMEAIAVADVFAAAVRMMGTLA